MKKSWKTTTIGALLFVQALVTALVALLDADAATNPDWGMVATAGIAAAGLLFARDNDKTSEDVGAKK